MNLKPRNRSEVYDRLYVLASKLLTKSNACASCPISAPSSIFKHTYSKSWCCGGCRHLGPTGCTVEALGCKLHICPAEQSRQTKKRSVNRVQDRLYKLKLIACHYQIWVARGDKEESLEHGGKDFWVLYPNSYKEAV